MLVAELIVLRSLLLPSLLLYPLLSPRHQETREEFAAVSSFKPRDHARDPRLRRLSARLSLGADLDESSGTATSLPPCRSLGLAWLPSSASHVPPTSPEPTPKSPTPIPSRGTRCLTTLSEHHLALFSPTHSAQAPNNSSPQPSSSSLTRHPNSSTREEGGMRVIA